MIELEKTVSSIRRTTFKIIAEAGGGHFGGSLSVVDILTVLYFEVMNIDPADPEMEDRDRFILSKGHGGPALYCTLAERGFFPKNLLSELDKNGGRIPKHVDRLLFPNSGIDASSGALGQGLSVGVGMAISLKRDKRTNRVYVVMGDGECNEGQIWEAAMTAAKYKLDNLTGFVDRNVMQVDGNSNDVMPLEPFADKWAAFGWNTLAVDGHNVSELIDACNKAKNTKGKPTVIIANTIKGKGVSFMENRFEWHSGSISKEQLEIGLKDLDERL
jgi:transketolase